MTKPRRARYFRRDGAPINDLFVWAKLFENKTYCRVAETILEDGTRISTVWLGLDHNYSAAASNADPKEEPPLIFETMVFSPETKTIELLGHTRKVHEDWDIERYSTEADAIIGHDAMVRKWKAVREQWKRLRPAAGVVDTRKPTKPS